jgi:4'-phosphopantetheinyl transferase
MKLQNRPWPVQNVHIWQVSLLQSQDCVSRLAQTLSPDEHDRAQRFHFEQDRRRFIVGRSVLRDILARYLDVDAKQISFEYFERGKPYLSAIHTPGIQFNVAHSHELAIYAIACEREVGVDLEYIHPVPEIDQIAASFFAAAEYQTWRTLPEDQKLVSFFNCWTRKEAYLKATGDGLSKPLDQFEVSLVPDHPARLLRVEGNERETQRWSLRTLELDQANYVGALAVENVALKTTPVEMLYWKS